MYRTAGIPCVVALALAAGAAGQDLKTSKAADGPARVTRERVKGSINHGGGKTEWLRITGRVRVIDARTLEFADGTRIELDVTSPHLDQMAMKGDELYPCGREAAEFLRRLIGDRPVTCFGNAGHQDRGPWSGYAGDVNLE